MPTKRKKTSKIFRKIISRRIRELAQLIEKKVKKSLVVKKKVVLLQSQNTRYGGEKRGEVEGK
jgi:hypothetical protein